MKILAIGDFHGEFPEKLKRRIEKENIDLILSPGDYCGNKELSRLFFKHLYGKDESEVPLQILKKIDILEKESLSSGIKVIERLKKFKIKVYGVRGNWDPLPWEYDLGVEADKQFEFGLKRFEKVVRKDFEFIDFRLKKIEGFEIIGGTSSTSPGFIKKEKLKRIREALGKEEGNRYIQRWKKHYNKRKGKYEKLFKKAGNAIFLTHNCPYKTKLDKLKRGPKKGEHYGSWLEKEMITKYQPLLVICGHMHENQGMQKIGKSIVVNTGAAHEGKAAIIEIDEQNKKIKSVKFLK